MKYERGFVIFFIFLFFYINSQFVNAGSDDDCSDVGTCCSTQSPKSCGGDDCSVDSTCCSSQSPTTCSPDCSTQSPTTCSPCETAIPTTCYDCDSKSPTTCSPCWYENPTTCQGTCCDIGTCALEDCKDNACKAVGTCDCEINGDNCDSYCGNGIEEAREGCDTCPTDVGWCDCSAYGSCCTDYGTCDPTCEYYDTCRPTEECSDPCTPGCPDAGKCGKCGNDPCRGCGNGRIDETETCLNCPEDVGPCTGCGDGNKDENETCLNCPKDVGPCTGCGDRKIDDGETCYNCPEDVGYCLKWLNLRGYVPVEAQRLDTILMSASGMFVNPSEINFSVGVNKQILFWSYYKNLALISVNSFLAPYVFVNSGNFYFIVNDNGILSVELPVEYDELDSDPSAEILHPHSYAAYFVAGSNVSFDARVSDVDDFLNVTWDFGDLEQVKFYNYAQAIASTESLSTNHSYSRCGVYNVQLIAKETERSLVAKAIQPIFVFKEGICVFPVISSPVNGRTNYTRLVGFNAEQSFVTNCTSGYMDPAKVNFTVGTAPNKLNCTYVHERGQRIVDTSKYNLSAEWTINPPGLVYRGPWGARLTSGTIQDFYWWFEEEAERFAQLSLTFSN